MRARIRSKFAAAAVITLFLFVAEFNAQSSGTTSTDQKTTEAQQAMDRADKLRASWAKASLQEAIEQYDKAALLWISVSDFANASQATLNAADVYFLFSDYREALKRFRHAEALAEKVNDWLAKANALSRIGRVQTFIGNNELARLYLIRALDLFKQHEADHSEIARKAHGEALGNLAEVTYAVGDFVTSRAQFKSALELVENDPRTAAKIRIFNGYISGSLGDSEQANREISQALEFYRQVNDKLGEGLALTALGLVHSHNSEHTRAIELHQRAIAIFRAAGDRHSEALTLNAMGTSYELAKQNDLALNQYEQALRLFEEIGSPDGISVTTFQLARIHQINGRTDQALTLYERSLQLSRAAGKVRTEINTLNQLAALHASEGRRKMALSEYQKILKFYKGSELRARAIALNTYANSLLEIRENQKALEACLEALRLSDKMDDKAILTPTLFNLARAHLAVGSPDVALSVIRRSLEMIEDVRANMTSPEFRLSYFSEVGKHYELCVDILMQLDRVRPGQGFAADALLVSEQGRARLLRDLVYESQANLRRAPSTSLGARERELRELFRIQAQYRMDLILNEKGGTEISAVDSQLAQLRIDYQQVHAQLRQQNPRLFSIQQASPVTLHEIQNELRDGDTMLLEFALGNERSYLWAVTSNSLKSYQLPARRIIEDAARELYGLITARQPIDGPIATDYQSNVEAADSAFFEKATNLSQMLLGPVAEQLGSRRLVIVTEGVLQHIPLDALPVPAQTTSESTSRTLIIERNEVIVLPSVSALMAIRGGRKHPILPNKLIAVIADPVLNISDDRVQSEAVSRGVALASDMQSNQSSQPTQTREGGLARLAHASEEADAISAVAPWGTTLVVKGFDANRDTAMSSEVGQYQIVHFATHGFVDSEHPELSCIVLSSVDRNGKATNGVMALHDIYSLDLSVELTVLSACQSALGKDIKGEGLIGLTHSFISAGSKSVVATLWKVDDRATASLMADFYEMMFRKGLSPAAALRSAKLKMMRGQQSSAPYYWAGFVLEGEYANRIDVDHHRSLRLALVLLFLSSLVVGGFFVFQRMRRRPAA